MEAESKAKLDPDVVGQVVNLLDLVDYRDGSIVSRTVLSRDTGVVTLFAFDAEQSVSEHTVPHDAWVQVSEGQVEFRIARAPHHLKAGEAIILPAHKPHSVRALERFKMVLTLIKAPKSKD